MHRDLIAEKRHPLAIAYVISMLICWLPIPLIGYVVPPLCIAIYTLWSGDGQPLKRYIILTGLAFGLVLTWYALEGFFLFQNAVIAYITYNIWICMACLPSARHFSLRDLRIVERSVFAMILFQSLIGIAEAVYGYGQTGSFDIGNGDYVRGTLSLSLELTGGFSNPTFAANMSFLLLAGLRSFWQSRSTLSTWRIVSLALGAVSLVLASVVHILGFLVVALLLAWLLMMPKKKLAANIAVLTGLTVFTFLVYSVLSKNLSNLPEFAETFLEKTPRGKLVQRVFGAIPEDYPLMPYIGLGPGQFCSRAGLIAGGTYFGGPGDPNAANRVPLITPLESEPLNRYQLDLWYSSYGTIYDGSNYRPFSSWISTYTEFGAAGVLLVFFVILRLLRRALRWGVTSEGIGNSFVFVSGVLLMFLLGFQENYWEIPQAIFPGAFYLFLLHRHTNVSMAQKSLQPRFRAPARPNVDRVRVLQPVRA